MTEPHPSHEERTQRTPEALTRQWARIRQPPEARGIASPSRTPTTWRANTTAWCRSF